MRIGFGTAHLYGARENGGVEGEARLVEAAIDAGIDWIDTAPLYGHGASEGIVGRALQGRRDAVTLVSKVGIEPTRMGIGYRIHGKVAAVMGKLPLGESLVPPPAPLRPQFGMFHPDHVVRSVERSLKALRTDRLDYLLLHECNVEHALSQPLLSVLQSLVEQGKILAFGLATGMAKTLEVSHSAEAQNFALWQLPFEDWMGEQSPKDNLVLHTLFGPKLREIEALIGSNATLRKEAEKLEIDPDNPMLAARRLGYAARKNGVVAALFSTSRSERLSVASVARELSEGECERGEQLRQVAFAVEV